MYFVCLKLIFYPTDTRILSRGHPGELYLTVSEWISKDEAKMRCRWRWWPLSSSPVFALHQDITHPQYLEMGWGSRGVCWGSYEGGNPGDLVPNFADNNLFGCSSISPTYPRQSVLHPQIVTQPHFYWCLKNAIFFWKIWPGASISVGRCIASIGEP